MKVEKVIPAFEAYLREINAPFTVTQTIEELCASEWTTRRYTISPRSKWDTAVLVTFMIKRPLPGPYLTAKRRTSISCFTVWGHKASQVVPGTRDAYYWAKTICQRPACEAIGA